jgi:hypothetical protein
VRRPPLEIALGADLLAAVEQGAAAVPSPVAEALAEALRVELGASLAGVVFYGSQLNRTAGARSDWDFFVLVDSYRAAHRSRLHAQLNRVLPPSVYRRRVALADGSTPACKLSIVSMDDLERYTSAAAPDSYVFGRLSKRVSVVLARDERTRRRIVEALARSVALCAAWTLASRREGASIETLAQESVAFSYRCEERVEGPSRAGKLFEADAGHYRAVYRAALAAQVATGRVQIGSTGIARWPRSDREGRLDQAAVVAFVRASRRRARLRWLKNVYTFEGWDDYMLVKLERHQELRIALSDRERRHPVLAAARHYVRLRRSGRLSRPGEPKRPDRRS